LKRELGVDARLVEGSAGEFRVLVGDEEVGHKERRFGIFSVFPKSAAVVEAVRARLSRASGACT
jgi:hypothetical protein